MPKSQPFTISLDQYTLVGSVVLPDQIRSGERAPVAVILGGPDPVALTRYSSEGALRWPMAWSHAIAKAGIVSLCYDQRGSGQSTGEYADADRSDLLQEAREAVAMARVQPETAGVPCVAIGWGDGASFALQLAAEGAVDAAVLLAPPFRTAEARYEEQVRSLAQRNGLSERVVKLRVDQYRKEMTAIAQRVADGQTHSEQKVGDQTVTLNLSRFLQTANFDPAPVAAAVRKPVLLLHGDADPVVPPEESAMLASALQCPCRRITYPKLQHFIYQHPKAVADAVQWITQTLTLPH